MTLRNVAKITLNKECPNAFVTIVDTNGKTMMQKMPTNNGIFEIDFSKLSKGLYVLNVKDSKKIVATTKVVKL